MSPDARHKAAQLELLADEIAALRRLPFVTPKQAAVILQLDASTVRRLVADGSIKAVRLLGKRAIRIRPAALDDLVE